MSATFNKRFLSLPQQVSLLKQRGLEIVDDADAEDCLHCNSYYRMSAYWYLFRASSPLLDGQGNPQRDSRGKPLYFRTDSFLTGSTFEDAQALYMFDKRFKLLLMDAVERVETSVRAEIALCLGQHDVFAHTKPCFFRHSYCIPGITTQMYSVCCVLSHFTKTIDPKSDWSQKLAELVKEFPQMPHASIKDMGFPADWQSHNFWN